MHGDPKQCRANGWIQCSADKPECRRDRTINPIGACRSFNGKLHRDCGQRHRQSNGESDRRQRRSHENIRFESCRPLTMEYFREHFRTG